MTAQAAKIVALAMVSWGVLCGCSTDNEDNESQHSLITTYLQNTHSPTLIPESEVADTIDEDPAFYSTFGEFAYRYISTYYDEGREAMAEITTSSRISITFELYPTTNGSVTSGTMPSYTNNPYYEDLYIEEGLNVAAWDFTPLEITMGSDHLLSGIEEALVGCRKGDLVEIYMTCNMAYGKDVMYLIDEYSALLFVCLIDDVEN